MKSAATSAAANEREFAAARTLRRITMAVVWRKSAEVAEVAADFPFCHRSNDQDYPEIAPNDADGLVT